MINKVYPGDIFALIDVIIDVDLKKIISTIFSSKFSEKILPPLYFTYDIHDMSVLG